MSDNSSPQKGLLLQEVSVTGLMPQLHSGLHCWHSSLIITSDWINLYIKESPCGGQGGSLCRKRKYLILFYFIPQKIRNIIHTNIILKISTPLFSLNIYVFKQTEFLWHQTHRCIEHMLQFITWKSTKVTSHRLDISLVSLGNKRVSYRCRLLTRWQWQE